MKYENGIETKQDILKVSRKLFFENGFRATSIREIAGQAHISSGALYKHFKSKEEILDEIVSPYVECWWESCAEELKKFENILEQVSSKEEMSDLVLNNSSVWVYESMVQNEEVWHFIFFKSKGTKYESFLNNLVDWEYEITLRCLEKLDKGKKYHAFVSDREIYYIIEGFFNQMISPFEKKLDEKEVKNYWQILDGIYKPFWEKIFMLQC